MTDAKKQQVKKILGIVGNVLIWIFLVFSIVVTVFSIMAQGGSDGVPELFGKSLVTIQSESMEDTFYKGDLVIMKKLSDEDKMKLVKDDIITFKANIDDSLDGSLEINTHRIHSIDYNTKTVITKGDNALGIDTYSVNFSDIIGICNEEDRIPVLGGIISFFSNAPGFFLCIVLPLILFFLYELYNFISILITEKAKKAPVSKETEEEIKRRAIEEYLAQQNKSNEENSSSEEAKEEPAEDKENTEE